MAKKVLISTDSTCDLPLEITQEYGINIIPLYVNIENKSHRDGVDIKPDDIYKYFEEKGKLPSTAAIPPGDFSEMFAKLKLEYDEIVHISISSELSSTYNNSVIAAAEFEGIYCVDSRNLSTGIGMQVFKAAELQREGKNGEEIADFLKQMAGQIDSSFVIDTLDYLCCGGRCSAIAAFGANLLKLKPCIEVKNGKMGVGKKYRGKIENTILDYIDDRLNKCKLLSKRVFVTHSGCAQEMIDSVVDKLEKTDKFDQIIVTRAGCTISNHCGPNTLGIMLWKETDNNN